MKILVLAARFPYPTERGDKLRLYHQLRLLAKRHQIILCALTEHVPNEQDLAIMNAICDKIYLFRLTKIQILFNLLNGFLQRKALQVAYFNNRKIERQIAQIAHIEQSNVVYCQLIRMAMYAEALPFPKVLDYMDAFSVAAERRAQTASPLTRWFWRSEARKLTLLQNRVRPRFDASTAIAAQDDAFMNPEKLLPLSVVVPNGVDTGYFSVREIAPHSPLEGIAPPSPPEGGESSRWTAFSPPSGGLGGAITHDLVFVGNMGYFPNVEAAKWLVQNLLPQLPNAKLFIAGARPTTEVTALANTPNVTVQGWTADIRTAYANARIFVAPLFHGSGQQNKILEAMAMGIPCVTTEIVNNAIGAMNDEQILVAETPEQFAAAILKLQSDEIFYQNIRQNALNFVQQQYSWETAVALLENLLQQVL